jgi:methyl-accepting chemotaxis protein/methyl-accepting chemotaxis protein-1 (serine sensor receptor)
MSLGRKLLSGFAAMLALVLLTSGGALLVTHTLNGDLTRAANVTARKQYLAGEVNSATAEMASCERGAVLSDMLSDPAHLDEYQRRFRTRAAGLQKFLEELNQLAEGGETASMVQALNQQAALVLQGHEELTRAMAGQKMDAALATFSQKVQPRLEEIGKATTSLVDQENRELATASAASASTATRSTAITLALTLLALGVGAGVFWIVRRTSASLKTLSARIADSAAHVANAAKQVSSASQSLAQGASEQAASLEETSASTEEIVSITRKNADHASEVAGLMHKTEEDSVESNRTLDRMVEQMKEIDGSSHKIARIIKINFSI